MPSIVYRPKGAPAPAKPTGAATYGSSQKLTAKDITDFVAANAGDPAAISQAMQQYGVSLADVQRAGGWDRGTVDSYAMASGDPWLQQGVTNAVGADGSLPHVRAAARASAQAEQDRRHRETVAGAALGGFAGAGMPGQGTGGYAVPSAGASGGDPSLERMPTGFNPTPGLPGQQAHVPAGSYAAGPTNSAAMGGMPGSSPLQDARRTRVPPRRRGLLSQY